MWDVFKTRERSMSSILGDLVDMDPGARLKGRAPFTGVIGIRRVRGWVVFMALAPLAVLVAWAGLAIAVTAKPMEWQRALFGAALVGVSVGVLVGGLATYWEQLRSGRISLPRRPRVRPVRGGRRNPHLDRVARALARRRSKEVLRAGISSTPSAFYYRWVRIAAYSLAGLAPASITVSLIIGSPLPLLLMAAPLAAILVGPDLVVRSAAGDRRRGAEDELPFFALYSSVMASAGVQLYEAMRRLIGRGIYRRLEGDAVYLQRSVEFMGEDQMTAIDRLARSHPSRSVRDFLYGYSSELRSGGDAAGYLSGRAEELLRWLQFRFERYADSVSDMGEMMTAMFFVLPAIVLTTAFVAPSASMGLVWIMSGLVIPATGVLAVLVIRGSQPRTGDVFRGNATMGAAAGIAAGILTYLTSIAAGSTAAPWAPLAAAIISGSIAHGVPVHLKLRAISEEERSLPDFLRDVTEYRKAGYTVSRAIVALAASIGLAFIGRKHLNRAIADVAVGAAVILLFPYIYDRVAILLNYLDAFLIAYPQPYQLFLERLWEIQVNMIVPPGGFLSGIVNFSTGGLLGLMWIAYAVSWIISWVMLFLLGTVRILLLSGMIAMFPLSVALRDIRFTSKLGRMIEDTLFGIMLAAILSASVLSTVSWLLTNWNSANIFVLGGFQPQWVAIAGVLLAIMAPTVLAPLTATVYETVSEASMFSGSIAYMVGVEALGGGIMAGRAAAAIGGGGTPVSGAGVGAAGRGFNLRAAVRGAAKHGALAAGVHLAHAPLQGHGVRSAGRALQHIDRLVGRHG